MSRLPLRKNDRVDLTITGLTAEGSGVGHMDSFAVFVPNTAVGDRITAHLILVKKNYAVGRLHQMITPSQDRIKPDCPVFSQCGGCALRHLAYEAELREKQCRVRDAMERIGHIHAPCRDILGAAQTDGYRNKAQYPVALENDTLKIGFYAPHSHRVVPCRDCLLQPPAFRGALEAFARWVEHCPISCYDDASHTGLLRHIYLRQAEATGELMACAVINGHDLPDKDVLLAHLMGLAGGLKSVAVNYNRERTNVILGQHTEILWGTDTITDKLCGLDIRISPHSFYQVNRRQAERLYEKAAEYAALTGREVLLDLYCGAGTIGLSMAAQAGQVIGVEAVPQAVDDARANAQRNGIANVRFLCDDAAGAAATLLREGVRPDVVVLDPPRKGCGEALVSTVSQMNPGRVVYVSCDPATLARDCAFFAQKGYAVVEYTPVDLFPRTIHVETVAVMTKMET